MFSPLFRMYLRPQTLHRLDDAFSVGHSGSLLNDVSGAIENDDRGDASHAVSASRAFTWLAQQAQPNHLGLSFQVSFNPINDGLGHQAGASSVAVKLDHHRLPGGDPRFELVHRGHVVAFGTQKDKGEYDGREHD